MTGPFPAITLADATLLAQRRILLWLHQHSIRPRRAKAEPQHLVTGRRGEFEAMFYLRRQGYRMVERRWRTRGLNGDIDLIAWDGATLVFIEVKARTRRDFFAAESTIDEAKRKMLFRMARAYVRSVRGWEQDPSAVRFDVVAVYLLGQQVECNLTRNAFQPEGAGWFDAANRKARIGA